CRGLYDFPFVDPPWVHSCSDPADSSWYCQRREKLADQPVLARVRTPRYRVTNRCTEKYGQYFCGQLSSFFPPYDTVFHHEMLHFAGCCGLIKIARQEKQFQNCQHCSQLTCNALGLVTSCKYAWKRGAKVRVDGQESDMRHAVPDELAYDREVHIHQGRWL